TMINSNQNPALPQGASTPSPEVRAKVKELLLQSESFRHLPPERQQEIARHTVEVCDYLARPEGISWNQLQATPGSSQKTDPYAFALEGENVTHQNYQENLKAVQDIGRSKFEAGAAREGAAVAGTLLKQINFPTFVASLIKGVFHSIVE